MEDAQARLGLTRALFPDLAAEVDAAWAANGRAGGTASLDAWIDRRADAFRAAGGAGSAFDGVVDAAARASLEGAFSAARAAFARGGIAVPEPEAFADAGVSLEALGELLAADPGLAPVPAPHGLGAEAWSALLRRAGADAGAARGVELIIASEIERELTRLDRAPGGAGAAVIGSRPEWTLRLIPAGPAPELLGLSFAHGPHPSLAEILALQLLRIEAGLPPVDASSFTWIAGSLADGRLAARHVFDQHEGAIRITAREPGNQGPHLGARPPRAG